MDLTAPPDTCSADQYVTKLVRACEQMGYLVHVHEPSTRLTVSLDHGKPYTHETITLRMVGDDLMWCWSWGAPMVPAAQIGEAARMIANVVRG